MKKPNTRHTFFTAMLVAILLAASTISIISARAAVSYHVTLSISNMSNQALAASADDLSDPAHAMFSLQNGTSLWYGIAVQSTPTGVVPTPTVANPTGDLVSTSLYGAIPLLPPVGVLPFDQTGKTNHFEALRLMTTFTGPGQQVQLTLNPFESHAIILDIYTLLLQLLGEQSPNAQIGLLAPNFLQQLFTATSTMKDFTNVANSYTQVLQNTTDKSAMLGNAYTFAQAVETMLADAGEQKILADILWKMLGKALPYTSVLRSISSFTSAQFGLGLESFIRDSALILSSTLLSQSNPTVVLQSIPNTTSPTATPTITRTPVTPTLTPTPAKPTTTPTPLVMPSPTVIPKNIPNDNVM